MNLERTVNRCLEALIPDSGTADVTDEVMRIVSTHELGDACGIYRLEAGEGRAVLEYGWQAAGSGNAAKLPEHLELAPGGDWLERMEKGEVVRGGVLSSSDPVLRQLCTGAAGRPGFRSALASGIRVSERLDGFAVLLFRGGEEVLNKMEDRAIVAISRILSLAAEKRRSLEQLKRSEREKSMIIDHIDTAIMLLDGREHLIKVNPAAAAITGKSEAELLAEPCYQNFCGCGPDFDKCPVSESFRTRRPAVLDVEIGGRSYIASAVPVLDDDGEIINVIHTLVDVTNRKETEAKIRGSLKEAEVANRAKSTFLATMSHEIRTPLNAIIGFSEILKNEGLPAEALESVEAINAAGESLLALINDVLEISTPTNWKSSMAGSGWRRFWAMSAGSSSRSCAKSSWRCVWKSPLLCLSFISARAACGRFCTTCLEMRSNLLFPGRSRSRPLSGKERETGRSWRSP